MTLPAIVLAAALGAAQETTPPPPDAPAVSEAPASAEAAIEAGLKAFKRRRYTQAEAEFQRAVAAEPGSAAAHFYLGYTYYKRGEPSLRMNENKQKARDHFAKAFELDPGFRPVWGRKK